MSKKQRLIALKQKLSTAQGVEAYLNTFTEAIAEVAVERVCPEAFAEPYTEPNNNKKQRLTAHQERLKANAAIEASGIWLI